MSGLAIILLAGRSYPACVDFQLISMPPPDTPPSLWPKHDPALRFLKRMATGLLLYGLLLLGTILALLPLLWMVAASLMLPGEANSYPPRLWPSTITFQHYIALFTRLDLAHYLLNSLFLASAVTAIALVINSMAGYAFAKFRFRGRDRLFRGLLATMVIPAQVAMLPLFLLLKQFGLINTYWGVIIPGMASIFGIFLIRQYLLAIPDSLLDAARMDGAGEFRIYWSLILPLCRPILVTLAIFTFLGAWNDFMWSLIILTDTDRYTLPVALANLLGEHVQDTELMMAGSVLTVLPVMLLFVALQKYYIAGIMLGGMKG
jgi:multiple sugar transport system permease protein